MARKKALKAGDAVLDEYGEEMKSEYADAPDSSVKRKQAVKQKTVRRWFTAGIVGALSLAGLAACNAMLNSNRDLPTVSSVDINDSAGKAVAVDALLDWLVAEPAPLDGGRMISWNGVESILPPEPPSGGNPETSASKVPKYTIELHAFTVVDNTGQLYTATVTVEASDELGARLVSEPTVMPLAPTAGDGTEWGANPVWYGYSASQTEAAALKSIETWAAAYTGGDPAALRLVVGDGDANHSYMPLGASTFTTVKAIAAGQLLTEPGTNEIADPTTMLVRVELRTTLNGQSVEGFSETDIDNRAPIVYDLLLTGADTATPRVVSWGPTGSGPSLTPYSVAIDGREVKSSTATPVPTSTEAPDGEAPADQAPVEVTVEPAPPVDPNQPATPPTP